MLRADAIAETFCLNGFFNKLVKTTERFIKKTACSWSWTSISFLFSVTMQQAWGGSWRLGIRNCWTCVQQDRQLPVSYLKTPLQAFHHNFLVPHLSLQAQMMQANRNFLVGRKITTRTWNEVNSKLITEIGLQYCPKRSLSTHAVAKEKCTVSNRMQWEPKKGR